MALGSALGNSRVGLGGGSASIRPDMVDTFQSSSAYQSKARADTKAKQLPRPTATRVSQSPGPTAWDQAWAAQSPARLQSQMSLNSALADYSYGNAAAQLDAQKQAAANRSNQDAYRIDRKGLEVDQAALARQQQYLADMYAIATGQGWLKGADLNVNDAANNRRYDLISADRADAAGVLQRAQAEAQQQVELVDRKTIDAKRQEKLKQRELLIKAAGQGNVGVFNAMNSNELKESAVTLLQELAGNRATVLRNRDQAEQDYNTAMRNLDEQWRQTDDQRERNRIERQRQELEAQERRRQQEEDQAKLKDQQVEAFLRALTIEKQRRDAQDMARFYAAAAAQQKAQQQAQWDAAVRQYQLDTWNQAAAAYQASTSGQYVNGTGGQRQARPAGYSGNGAYVPWLGY